MDATGYAKRPAIKARISGVRLCDCATHRSPREASAGKRFYSAPNRIAELAVILAFRWLADVDVRLAHWPYEALRPLFCAQDDVIPLLAVRLEFGVTVIFGDRRAADQFAGAAVDGWRISAKRLHCFSIQLSLRIVGVLE